MVEAVRCYQLAAEQGQGHAAAQFNLGRCFQRGDGVAPDLAAEGVRSCY